MKIHLIILAALTMSIPVLAQQTNDVPPPRGDRTGEYRNGERGERKNKERREMTPEQKEQMQERRLQMMEKTLKDIGVTEQQQALIIELQARMKEQMRVAFLNVEEKKAALKKLEEAGASLVEIDSAIDAVSDAQADQMKILARNRIQMERILGKEKFKLFMDSARTSWKEHGRRGGSGMPPLPRSIPPIPSDTTDGPQPPKTTPPTP